MRALPRSGGGFHCAPSSNSGAREGTAASSRVDEAGGGVRGRARSTFRGWGFTWKIARGIARHRHARRQPGLDRQRARADQRVIRRLASATAETTEANSVKAEFDLAEMQYTNAIAGLESITKSEQSALDMDTADVLKANLTVIDGAITESRAALQTEPDNPIAQESLFDALRSKLELLQDVVSLINEMRKGNPEGAARIVSGLNQ